MGKIPYARRGEIPDYGAPTLRDTRPQSYSGSQVNLLRDAKRIVNLYPECGLPYTIKPINIGRGDQLIPDFLKISPNGRMPAIVDHEPMGGGAPISIFESGPS